MIQSYSCAGSPFLMFLPFICLALPDDSAFMTAEDNDGNWENLGNRSHKSVLESPGLVHINHGKTGTSEIIPGRRLAMITYRGWDKLESMVHTNRNAEADESTVMYAYKKRVAKNPAIQLPI